jgi:hypothetical protein
MAVSRRDAPNRAYGIGPGNIRCDQLARAVVTVPRRRVFHSSGAAASRSAADLAGGVAQKSLDDEHVAPLAIEAALAAVHSHLAEAAAVQERAARLVLRKQAADQLQ